MKKIITILLLGTTFSAKSQIEVTTLENFFGKRKNPTENIEKLRFLFTTVFVLQTGDSLRRVEFENALSQVWTVNKFKVILPNEKIQYVNRIDCAIASFNAYTSDNKNDGNVKIFYDLSLPKLNKKGEIKEWISLSRIGLFPEDGWWSKMYNSKEFDKKESESKEILKLLPTSVHFKNWSPGFIKGYFKRINDLIINEKSNLFHAEYIDLDNLKKLKNDTLYLPEYIKEDREIKSNIGWVKSFKEKNLIVENFPYKIVFIEQNKLDSMILYRKEKFYYLTHIQDFSNKYVSIFEGTTGNILYSKNNFSSFNFKIKDLEKIAEAIK